MLILCFYFFTVKRKIPCGMVLIFFTTRFVITKRVFSIVGYAASPGEVICDALSDLVSFVQFKKREKYPWRSVNFSKVAG